VVGPVTQPPVVGGTPVSSTWGQAVDVNLAALLGRPVGWFYQSTVTPQSIPDNTNTALSFVNEAFDTASGHLTTGGTNNEYVTPAGWAGYWRVDGVFWVSSATAGTSRYCWVNVNGAEYIGSRRGTSSCSTGNLSVATSAVVFLNVGDTVQIGVYQNSGAALPTIATSPELSSMAVEWLRAA
jgi:hypothetical protein